MKVIRERFGTTPDGTRVDRFTIRNSRGLAMEAISYGCIVTSFEVPDRGGRTADIVLGYDTLEEYMADPSYFGVIVGRVANRISRGGFFLDGKEYPLCRNFSSQGQGSELVEFHCHGGEKGFHTKVWQAEEFQQENSAGIRFRHLSKDGDEGYPGSLTLEITYGFSENNELSFVYKAWTDAPTPVNLTNHSYWNLAGAGSGDIRGHVLQLHCPFYLPTDVTGMPTGEVRSVAGTPMDFTTPKPIGQDLDKVEGGYDHCFVAGSGRDRLKAIARVRDPASGRGMEVFTTKPGVQLYTSNVLEPIKGAGNAMYGRHGALCLETQFFPDSVNRPHFPSCILRPGETYDHVTKHLFFID